MARRVSCRRSKRGRGDSVSKGPVVGVGSEYVRAREVWRRSTEWGTGKPLELPQP